MIEDSDNRNLPSSINLIAADYISTKSLKTGFYWASKFAQTTRLRRKFLYVGPQSRIQ